jgi:transglutaminase-like putative cysteine protease
MIKRILGGWRHLVRVLAMALAALSLAWGIALTEGLVAAMFGAALGVVVGELLGRSRVKLGVTLAMLGLLVLVTWKGGAWLLTTEWLAEAVGPGNTLAGVGVARFASLAFVLTASLRAVALRRPAALALELGFIAVAVTGVFASHRDGVIARPLWLSDWAWQQGIDPTQVFLVVGAVAVALLALLLVAETKSGRALSSLVVLGLLAALAVLSINMVGAPTPQPEATLGLTDAGTGGPPRTTPDASGLPNHQPNTGDGGSGRNDPDRGDAGGNEGPDAGGDGGGASGGDAGDGGAAAGGDGGDGGAASGNDGGDGGSGGDGGVDAMMPQYPTDGSIDPGTPSPQDGGNIPPPSEQLNNDDQSPSQSPAPMAVVILENDYSPPSGAYYFRQEVWSQFNGVRLISTTRNDVDRDILDAFPTFETRVADVAPAQGRTRVEGSVALLVSHNHPFALESPDRFWPAPNPNPQRFLRAWRFSSLAQTVDYRRLIGRPAGDARWTPEVRAYYTQSHADPRFRQLAERIVTQRLPERLRRDPFARALAVKLWLDHELIYSTRERHAGVADPTLDFLFGNRTGYCVHFAHSAVFLWRSLGIPSRISTGYHSDESNRRGGSTIILRAADAHAWPELYIDGHGWIVLDIAAERNLDPPGTAPDEDLQRILGEMARQQPPDPTRPPEQQPRPRERRRYGRIAGYGFLSLLAAVVMVMYAVKLWRRVIPSFASARTLPRVGYRKALDLLAEAGLSREYGETRERFAERVKEKAPSFVALTELHLSARLGDPKANSATHKSFSQAAWRDALASLSRELPNGTKRWRRVLGFFNPASWLDAR